MPGCSNVPASGRATGSPLMMPNLLQYPVAIAGAFRAGLTVVNTNPLYTARELQHQLKDSGATAILILENFAGVLQEVLADTDVRHVIVTGVGDLLSAPKSLTGQFRGAPCAQAGADVHDSRRCTAEATYYVRRVD